MTEYTQIRYEQTGRVVTLTLNRPEKLNAWTGRMEEEIVAALDQVNNDPSVGCVIITGEGRGFCAGADIGGWADHQASDYAAEYVNQQPVLSTRVGREASPAIAHALRDAKPVIAAINGAAVGIGLTMALNCDIRIASDRARFSARFVRVGIIPEAASSHNLPAVAGIEAAMELVLTGRIIDASDPLAARLVSRIVPHDDLLPTARALAEEIAFGPTGSVWMSKRLLRANAVESDLRRVTDAETYAYFHVDGKPAHQEAIRAFQEKREPRFNA